MSNTGALQISDSTLPTTAEETGAVMGSDLFKPQSHDDTWGTHKSCCSGSGWALPPIPCWDQEQRPHKSLSALVASITLFGIC